MTTTRDFLATILENPADWAPRLVFADWLEEQGECDRAEFIRCQVESDSHPCNSTSGAAIEICGCRGHTLRRRESVLLAQTVEQPCPRCKGEGKVTFPDGKVPSEFGGNPYVVACDCAGKGVKVLPVSNAVLWAGKLGGREAIALDRPNEFIERSRGWHVRWLKQHDSISDHEIFARFINGFIGHVSLSCQALMGVECGFCRGARRVNSDRPFRYTDVCAKCEGSGYVGGLAAELSRFPLTGVELSDKRPYEMSQFAPSLWVVGNSDTRPPRLGLFPDYDTGEAHYVPDVIWSQMDGFIPSPTHNSHPTWEWYASAASAQAALSRAACGWVRSKRKEPVDSSQPVG